MSCDLCVAVPGHWQIVGDVGEGPHESRRSLVKRDTLRFALLEVVGDLRVAAEIVDVF